MRRPSHQTPIAPTISPRRKVREERITMRLIKIVTLSSAVLLVIFIAIRDKSVNAQSGSSQIGERPTLEQHINESDIENGAIKFKNLLDIGEFIFAARWTKLD